MLRLRDIGQFLLLLPLLLFVLLQTDLGSMLIRFQVEKELSQRCGRPIQIGKFDFSFPDKINLHEVRIALDEKMSLRIQEIDIQIPLTELIFGNASAASIDMAGIQTMGYEMSKV